MKRVFSGIQPSGVLHLGNYLGALQHFVARQADHDAFFCIVDLHALTTPQDPQTLKAQIRQLAAVYLAAGIDPDKATLFVQSRVSAHSELAWLLQCSSYMGELGRMTQFKEKSEGRESVSVALFTYPVLQAADILLYDTDIVPVGEDQQQHIELCRDLALRFNQRYGEVFVVPTHQIPKVGARIMSLDDPARKMSKSNPNPASYVSLMDDTDAIVRKIMRAVTDTGREIRFDPATKPGVSNLLSINSLCSNRSIAEVETLLQGKGYGDLKKDTAAAVVERIGPIRARALDLLNSGDLEGVLNRGAERAREVAARTMSRVQSAIGIK